MSCLGFTLFLLFSAAIFLWLAGEYTRYHPLDLTHRVTQVQKYLLPDGVGLNADKVELFFDDGPVLRVSGLGVTGKDGTLGIFVEQAAIKLASTQFFLLSAAPKVIEASGVTLRLVRDEGGVSIAGLALPKSKDSNTGVVDWLNGLGWNRVWGRLRSVRVANINLLVRDDLQHAEWVLEQGNMNVERYPEEGERGTLTAVVRRLYGSDNHLKDLDDVLVLVSFTHGPKADAMIMRGRLDRAEARMVTDYFPPQFKDFLQAEGQVEIGTRLLEENKIEQPWVTLRLTDVKVQPPEGFSSALEFPKLTVTASYSPPVAGVSNSDVLQILDLQALSKRGIQLMASGTITDMQGNTMVDMSLSSPQGELQGVFDLFPDQNHGFAKALKWLRPNIMSGDYANLKVHYAGKPGDFHDCGDHCGILDIDADVADGTIRYLDKLTPAKAPNGHVMWRGQTLTVNVPEGTVGNQTVSEVQVKLEQVFSVSPTILNVKGVLRGEAHELMAELGKLPDAGSKIPQEITGRHGTRMDITVPMPRGVEPTFAGSTVLVSSSLADIKVSGLKELNGLDFAAPFAAVSLDANKNLHIQADGTLGGNPMKADVTLNIAPHEPAQMRINAQGTVTAEWLLSHINQQVVSATGLVGIAANLQESPIGKWLFNVSGEGARSAVAITKAKFKKAKGERLSITASGSYVPSGTLVLEKLDVLGKGISLGGSVQWNPDHFANTLVNLPSVKIGETDVAVDLANGRAKVVGKKLDLSGIDVFGGSESDSVDNKVASTEPENLLLDMTLGELKMQKGELQNVVAQLKAKHGKWDVQKVAALVNNSAKVNVLMVPLKGQAGRKKLTIDVDNLGLTLDTLGIYDKLARGKMTGEITYDNDNVGGGVIKLSDFELKNPPTLVQLLSLLSLEQLLAGTNSTLFKTATIPVRVDGSTWFLDNASLVGPSMSLRMDGSYDRVAKYVNIDGKMAPGIPLNRLVGKIPLLGTLLTGSQDGVVVADFKLKGPVDHTEINVRPLSVITPGLLKDFWRGLTHVDDKPKLKVIDGRSK